MHKSLHQKIKILLPLTFAVLMVCLMSSTLYGQATITGKVVASEDQSPLPGVNILVKGTTNGTITDSDGNYSITTSDPNDILVFSFV